MNSNAELALLFFFCNRSVPWRPPDVLVQVRPHQRPVRGGRRPRLPLPAARAVVPAAGAVAGTGGGAGQCGAFFSFAYFAAVICFAVLLPLNLNLNGNGIVA